MGGEGGVQDLEESRIIYTLVGYKWPACLYNLICNNIHSFIYNARKMHTAFFNKFTTHGNFNKIS